MKASISGLEHCTLVAGNRELFQESIAFYVSIGFTVVRQFDRLRDANDGQQCQDSDQETWLLNFGEYTESSIMMKIKLIPASNHHGVAECPSQKPDPSQDWRGQNGGLMFQVRAVEVADCQIDIKLTEPQQMVELLKVNNLDYQSFPEKSPVELYTHDPLGTSIGFTSRMNPLSKTAHKSVSMPKRVEPAPEIMKTTAKRKRIGVMTSGGDSPGMNAVVRAVVRMSIALGCEAFGIYEGYEGLVQGGKLIKKMSWEDVRGWLSEGGTLIGTARSAAFRERRGRLSAAKHLIEAGIDALIVCGGDGSLTGADIFRAEWPDLTQELIESGELTKEQVAPFQHLTIAGLVGSIDNDMSLTDSTIGAYSSLHRICESVDSIGATALSHSRAFVIEVMGRHCGWLALMAGVSTGADFVLIPERPPSEADWQERMCESIKKHRSFGKRTTIVIVAEGAIDQDLNPIPASYVKDLLVERLKLDTRVTTLGHIQRGGTPCFYDRYLATIQGCEAVHAVLESTPDTPSPMIGITENRITRGSLMDAVKMTHAVAEAISRKDFRKAMDLRDPEFAENYETYIHTSRVRLDDPEFTLPTEKRLRVAIIHVGAPAGGMNPATCAAVRYCLNRGHTPLAVHNSFPGLIRHGHEGGVQGFTWKGVDGWTTKGGSEIGTNRDTPDIDLGQCAYQFQQHRFDGLIIIGGFEAFASLQQLYEGRKQYPAFRIPMVCLPATISNNVPGTDYSLGSDTCLNALIHYCDATKQSASASRRRVFVVEVQGGRCGYITTMAGLTVGALAIYTPEDGIDLKTLCEDVEYLKQSFSLDRGENRAGKLLLRNEKASSTYTTELIGKVMMTEAQGRFESRTAVPGHIQQGGTPSPMDRVRATRLAIKCMQFLETQSSKSTAELNSMSSATVIGIRGQSVVFTPIQTLWDKETDQRERRPLEAWWKDIKDNVNILSGRSIPEIVAASEIAAGGPAKL